MNEIKMFVVDNININNNICFTYEVRTVINNTSFIGVGSTLLDAYADLVNDLEKRKDLIS